MDGVRYFFALLIVISFPAVLPIWFVIHPLVAFWRRRGPVVTYVVVLTFALVAALGIYQAREVLLRVEYGFSWPLTIAAILVYALSIAIELQCRRQLAFSTLVGLPEVSEARESRLLTEGIYGKVRHPRYLGVMIGALAFALFVNYLAVYIVAAGTVPLLYLVVLLEERELRDRFGEEYDRYMERVPRFIPRIRSEAA